MKRIPLDGSTELSRFMMAGFQPAMMPKHDKNFQVFRYQDPGLNGKIRAITRLATTDILAAGVQLLGDGEDENLHLHAAMDGFWMVLSGRVSFQGEDEVVHEFGPLEGLMVPRGVKYAFKKISKEPALLLQVEGMHAKAKLNTYKAFPKPDAKPRPAKPSDWIDLYDAVEVVDPNLKTPKAA